MKRRGALITPEQYLQILKVKLSSDDNFAKSFSLSRLALTSYAPEGQQQYGIIYRRGAIIVGLLDIRLGLRQGRERLGKPRYISPATLI